jgi:hypothetical protein
MTAMIMETREGAAVADAVVPFDAEHLETWPLLPWHGNHTLRPELAARVERHLRSCLVCRRESELLKALATHVKLSRGDAECEAALARLNARITHRVRRPRQLPWAAAAMLAMSMALLTWTAQNAETSTAWLRNAGFSMNPPRSEETARRPQGPQVNLVFFGDVTERELRSLVLAIGAEVVEGPTSNGIYTLAFERQMSPGEVMEALRRLRHSRRVLFAEPAMNRKVGGPRG